MDASIITKKKQARIFAAIQKNHENTIARAQTPGQISMIKSQYPKSEFAFLNNLYPCGLATLCSTIYAPKEYYNSTN